jgi:hypothetical protein
MDKYIKISGDFHNIKRLVIDLANYLTENNECGEFFISIHDDNLKDAICDLTREFFDTWVGISLEKHNEYFDEYWKEFWKGEDP